MVVKEYHKYPLFQSGYALKSIFSLKTIKPLIQGSKRLKSPKNSVFGEISIFLKKSHLGMPQFQVNSKTYKHHYQY